MRYFFPYFLVIPTNFRHSFGHPQNETPHNRRAQPSPQCPVFPQHSASACEMFRRPGGSCETQRPPAERFLQQTVFSCASRSRTYDGGVKVPCLTAWRWRIMQNSIAYFPLFHKRCAAFLQLFLCAVCRTCGVLGRFLGFAAGPLRFPYSSMFLRKASFAGCVFQKTQSAGGTRFILQR